MKSGMRVNIEFAENGIICRVSKDEKDEDGNMQYNEETKVFPSMEECTKFLSENDLKPKGKDGKIYEAMTESD